MRGYENGAIVPNGKFGGFRIPMRGYELALPVSTTVVPEVPNPHEGL